VSRARQEASYALDIAQRDKPKPKPKPELTAADVISICVAKVEVVVRAAVSKLDSENFLVARAYGVPITRPSSRKDRLDLFDEIEWAIRAIKAEAVTDKAKAKAKAEASEAAHSARAARLRSIMNGNEVPMVVVGIEAAGDRREIDGDDTRDLF
jgi:hypothetical protein